MKKISMTTVLALALAVAGRAESVSDAFCEALNVSGLTFTTGGDAVWTVTTEDSSDGVSALQSGVIGHSQGTWFQTTIEGPRLISFMWKISSLQRHLTVSVDGGDKWQISGYKAANYFGGTTSWCRQYVYIDSGSHVVRWTFDGNWYADGELARIDQLEIGEMSEEIAFPSDLTTLENYALDGSRSLKRVVLPPALTTIPGSYFNGCTGLVEIEIPNTVGEIGDSAFYGCSSLQSIDLPNTVSNLGSSVFCDCSALKTVRLPNGLKTLKQGLFVDCSSLESVALPPSLFKIEGCVFQGCQHLTSIDLPETVANIGASAFLFCKSLKSVHLPGSVTEIGTYAFSECDSLESINIPTNLTTISAGMFKADYQLKNVEIPPSVISIGQWAFYGCSALTEMHLPDGVTELADYLFFECSALKTVTCSEGLTRIGNCAFQGCSSLEAFAIPDRVTTIGEWAFCDCSSLTEMRLPADVTEIAHGLFCNCSSLRAVMCSERLERLGGSAFGGCTSLAEFDIPVGVTEIPDSCFFACESLSKVRIPEGVTQIGNFAFENCQGIRSLAIPSTVWSMGYHWFAGCSNLQQVEFRGPPPGGDLGFNCRQTVPREYGAAWLKVQGINNFSGYANGGVFTVEVISSRIRENDPTVMDVVYKVTSSQPTVKVRVLAFEDGERSFAKVIRPETFIDGTAANVGDSVTANEEHTISWRVSSDWQTRLAKLQVEVFACEGELLPLELMTIPASDAYGKMKVTWNALSESQWLDALYWLYASKDAGLTLADGVLKEASSGGTLVSGTSVTYATSYWTSYDRDGRYVGYHEEKQPSAPQYVFGKMGYTLIESEVLTYVNDELRLGLSPSGARQYGYKIVP